MGSKESRGLRIYDKYVKRCLDIVCSGLVLVLLCWLYAILAVLVRIKLGSPVIFKQPRPGRDEKIFTMYKFRTMTDERDEAGNLMPDEVRLTKFGKMLRATSLDELPEALNIFKGDMSVVGPRPQLVRDMVFMTQEQRRRHVLRPGLTGWAQVNGRNCIEWDDKLALDLEYLDSESFAKDVQILGMTIVKVFKSEDINTEGMATAEDLGDMLLRTGRITRAQYDAGQSEAKWLIANRK